MKTIKSALVLIISCAIVASCTKEKIQDIAKPSAPAFDTAAALMGAWRVEGCNYNSSDTLARLNNLTLNPGHTYSLRGLFYYNFDYGAYANAYIGVKTESGQWSFKNQVLFLKPLSISEIPGPNTLINNIKISYNLSYGTNAAAIYDTSGFGNCLVESFSASTLKLIPVHSQFYAYTGSDCFDDYSWIQINQVQYQFVMGRKD